MFPYNPVVPPLDAGTIDGSVVPFCPAATGTTRGGRSTWRSTASPTSATVTGPGGASPTPTATTRCWRRSTVINLNQHLCDIRLVALLRNGGGASHQQVEAVHAGPSVVRRLVGGVRGKGRSAHASLQRVRHAGQVAKEGETTTTTTMIPKRQIQIKSKGISPLTFRKIAIV